MSVGQDANQSAKDPQTLKAAGRQKVREKISNSTTQKYQVEIRKTHLVEGQGVVEEQVTPNQCDAEFEMAKHIVAAGSSQGLCCETMANQICEMWFVVYKTKPTLTQTEWNILCSIKKT